MSQLTWDSLPTDLHVKKLYEEVATPEQQRALDALVSRQPEWVRLGNDENAMREYIAEQETPATASKSITRERRFRGPHCQAVGAAPRIDRAATQH